MIMPFCQLLAAFYGPKLLERGQPLDELFTLEPSRRPREKGLHLLKGPRFLQVVPAISRGKAAQLDDRLRTLGPS